MDKDIKVEKLSESNYYTWKFKILSVLEVKDLDDMLTSEQSENEAWIKRDKKTRAIIRLTVSDEIIPIIANLDTARNTWEALSIRFNQNSGTNKFFLRRKLYNIKKLENDSMHVYISKIRNIEHQLRSIGVNLDDEDMIAILLNGLSKEYDTVISNLETIQNLRSADVEARLILEEQKSLEDEKSEVVAFNSIKKKYNYKSYQCNE
jgi:hypothetical protein